MGEPTQNSRTEAVWYVQRHSKDTDAQYLEAVKNANLFIATLLVMMSTWLFGLLVIMKTCF